MSTYVMNKNDLLKLLADDGYNIGFGAKKHFATYDIIEKYPGWVSIISIGIGVLALVVKFFTNNIISATLITIGVATIYLERYGDKKESYGEVGVELTNLFNKMKQLYYNVKTLEDPEDINDANKERIEILEEYFKASISKQICFADWYAHYKFFWQTQIEWIEEQKTFSFWRDKVPLSFWILVLLITIITLIFFKIQCR